MAIEGKLTAGILATGQNKFGSSIATTDDGNTLLVGMPQPVLYLNQEPPAGQGMVLVYDKQDVTINSITYGTWPETNKLKSSAESYEYFNFGYSVACDSDASTVVVGERYATVSNVKFAGQVAIYTNAYANTETLSLATPKRDDRFGSSVAISGDGNVLVVGAPGTHSNNIANVGQAHVYFKVPNATSYQWEKQPITLDANTDKAANIFFGNSVAVSNSGDVIVVGAPGIDSSNNPNIGGAYIFTYEDKTEFVGEILVSSPNVLNVHSLTDSANFSIRPGQYVTGPNIVLGTKIVSQLSSNESSTPVVLSGYAGSNTITITSNVTSVVTGYGVTCATPGILTPSTVVTGIIGNTVTLSAPLLSDAVGNSVVFEYTYSSLVADPVDIANNTVIIGDYSNVKLGQFTDSNSAIVTGITYHNIKLSTPPIAGTSHVTFKDIGKRGNYEITPNNITSVNTMNSFAWRTYATKVTTPKEIAEGRFGDSVSVSGSGNTIVIGSTNGAFVFDSSGALKATLSGARQRTGDAFGSSVAINKDGNMIVVGAPDKSVAVVNAKEVYTDGIHDFMYEITTKETADWANLGVMSSNVTIANITTEEGIDIMYVTKCVDYANANLNAGIAKIPKDTFVTIPGTSNVTVKVLARLESYDKRPNASTKPVTLPSAPSANIPWRFSVEVKNTDTVHSNVYAIANTVSTVSSVYSTDGNISNAIITEGTRFLATNLRPNANIGLGTAISYNHTGIGNTGAVYKFVSNDQWGTWNQVRTCISDDEKTQWNKLGQQVAISNDGNTVFASSTGTEQFGRTNEGMVYVFNIK